MSNTLKYILRVIVGVIFLISATAKLISIDSFEIYIFGFEILSLPMAYLAARLIIAMEYTLGMLLILNMHSQAIYFLTFLVLAVFTTFLAVLTIAGNKENCNCFGELVQMTPGQSLVKNIILLVILRLSAGARSFGIKWKPLWYSLVVAGSIATVFIVSPPDNWRYESYSRSTTLNEEAFKEALEEGLLPEYIMNGDHIVCFYSMRCQFCRRSAQKIGTMRRMGTFSSAPVTAIIGQGTDLVDPAPFFRETRLDCNDWHFIPAEKFLRITNGEMPLILILKDGEVTAKYCYRDIH
jgi:Predicted membrane protein